MYKLLALDIDDTLLNSERELSPANKDAIKRASEAGVTVTISTGRAYRGARPICELMDLPRIPVITFGGAQITEYPEGKSIFLDHLDPSGIRELIQFAEDFGVHVQAYDGDTYLYREENDEVRYYEERLGYPGRLDDFTSDLERSCKVLMIPEAERMDDLMRHALKELGDRYHIVQSHARFLEFYKIGTDKGSAVRWMAEHLGLDRSEVVAMGDSGIDIPMIRYAGLGIAVANATEETKAAADLITCDANDDAVAYIVDTYIL